MAKAAEKKNGSPAAGTVITAPEPAVMEMLETTEQNEGKNSEKSRTKGVVNWGKEVNTLPYYLL